ncbi:F420-dependent oxidoreductase-like protein [Kribbella sp. VKM Ac-2571]|uniref:TIGR03560 family F420-dependent LLM class oxidoreductase n=1 Tax=Kribbella sp. VKM Ac-2571 TaxID=2512222 RepID=UPI00106173D3|nr:TIGR03560 family F420-dependent LLM class oxidoreductase [Kribbella sp. VKM Ac-2571]TDO69152.1 F420-dependent oxidoreductase-like protein [Kribbella sp. VKM Ac-2571]
MTSFSVFLPSGFGGELSGLEPADAFRQIVEVAQAADQLGFHAVYVPDHLHPIPPSQAPVFEAWTLLTAVAAATERVRIGPLVTSNSYRNPALQAKIASTVDVVSNGRVIFGIGAGWYEPDYLGYGYEFGTAGDRLRRLDEAVQLVRRFWAEESVDFEGKYYRASGGLNQPKGIQQPHIPILVAGAGEQKTLRTVARWADASNIIDSPAILRHKYDVLRKHCADAGRPYDDIWRTATTSYILGDSDAAARERVPAGAEFAFPGDLASYGLIGTESTIRDRIAAYEDAGVQELVVGFENSLSVDGLRQFAELFL